MALGAGLRAGAPTIASRRLLKDRAFDVIKELIQEETLPPGWFLSERQLSAWLGMSTTPIRSALNRLEEQGFIAVSPQQGAVVREASFREIVDVYDIRIAPETFVARSLAGRLAADQAARLRENHVAQDAAVTARDVARFTHLDTAFHVMLSESLDNREMVRVQGRLAREGDLSLDVRAAVRAEPLRRRLG